MHPTWRDLVIERLADDAPLRRRFLAHCGPHGIALALSTHGGAGGERTLPLVAGDEDWDAIGDRIYTLAPELEPREAVAVLTAVDGLLQVVLRDAMLAGEGVALARTVLERFGELWAAAHSTIELPCIEAWLSVAVRLNPQPRPTFLAATWAELLPVALPDHDDRPEIQRFNDWRTLCEVLRTSCPEVLSELGYGEDQDDLIAMYHSREHARLVIAAGAGTAPAPETFIEPLLEQHVTERTVRRVLADL